MGYKKTLEIAGAKVHEYEHFGSYQGDWLAKVTYENKTGWIHDYYGSCSGCDAFESEFGWNTHKCGGNDYHDPLIDGFTDNCNECDSVKSRIIEFGKYYLEDMLTQREVEEKLSKNTWDEDLDDMLKFVKKNSINN